MLRGLLLIFLFASPLTHASDLYRWTDAQGKVYYSDQPPPPNARQSSRVGGKPNVIDVDKESFESRLARERNPVVLYVSACGPICDQARDHLNQRGIPFSSKDPSKEPEIALELKKLVGTLEVPVILVGKTHTKGFERSSWDSLLDAAGYPKTPLPRTPPVKQP
jgi:glutaredoxin